MLFRQRIQTVPQHRAHNRADRTADHKTNAATDDFSKPAHWGLPEVILARPFSPLAIAAGGMPMASATTEQPARTAINCRGNGGCPSSIMPGTRMAARYRGQGSVLTIRSVITSERA